MSKNITQQVREHMEEMELNTYEKDRVGGLSLFIENRLANNEFMRTHTIDDLKELARNFDKQGGSDLDQIFSESLTLVERVKSKHVQDYGKLWDDIKLGISSDDNEEIRPIDNREQVKRALYFFQEILNLNYNVKEALEDLGFDVYDAAVLYYNLYLPKVLKTREEFDQIEKEWRCRLVYIGVNDLILCSCEDHKDNEMSKAYNEETYIRVASEFLDSDIYKGLVLLRYATSLLKKHVPVKKMQDLLQKYNKHKLGLSADILTEVWRIVVGRAPKHVQMKVMTHVARSSNSQRLLVRGDGTVINLVKEDGSEIEPSDLGIDPKSVEQWCIDREGRMIKEQVQRKNDDDMMLKIAKKRKGTTVFLQGPDGFIIGEVDLKKMGIDVDVNDPSFLEKMKRFKVKRYSVDKRGK